MTIATFEYKTSTADLTAQRAEAHEAQGKGMGQATAFLLVHALAFLRGETDIADQKSFAKETGWSTSHVSKACGIVKRTPVLAALVGKARGKYVADGAEVVATVLAFVEPFALSDRAGINTIYGDLGKDEDEDDTPVYSLSEDVARLFKRAVKRGLSIQEVMDAVSAEAERLLTVG